MLRLIARNKVIPTSASSNYQDRCSYSHSYVANLSFLFRYFLHSSHPRQLHADSLDDLASDFWAWRAHYRPFSFDDIPRMEHPGSPRIGPPQPSPINVPLSRNSNAAGRISAPTAGRCAQG